MNTFSLSKLPTSERQSKGFSLIEVVLAIGIFLVTVLALVGLLGPTLQSVDEVEKTDEVSSVVNTINAFLQNSPAIADATNSKFNNIFNAVALDGHATIFVFRAYRTVNSEELTLRVGFRNNETVGDPAASIEPADFSDAVGTIYRAVLTPSSVTPEALRSPGRVSDDVYTLNDTNVANYPEGYFAMEVRIFAEDAPGPNVTFDSITNLTELANRDPLFTYNTAVVR
jgi:Tfp pilus assembly protein PilV